MLGGQVKADEISRNKQNANDRPHTKSLNNQAKKFV